MLPPACGTAPSSGVSALHHGYQLHHAGPRRFAESCAPSGYQPMSTPIWLDEHDRRLPTRKCFKTDQEWAVRLDRDEHLRMNGWKLNKTLQIVVRA